jgi:hypothetical protein
MLALGIGTCRGMSSSSGSSYPGFGGTPPNMGGFGISQEDSDAPEKANASGNEANKKRSLKGLGLLDGRGDSDEQTYMITAPPPSQAELMQGSYGGRNPKKLKHRRINAVEVAERELEKTGAMGLDGNIDMERMTKLLDAQTEREIAEEQGIYGSAPMRQWTMEDLDREFETEEGNKRLGIVPDGPEIVSSQTRKRWERSSHFVDMRPPGKLQIDSLLPEDELNYRKYREPFTIFVQGSAGARYAMEVTLLHTVANLKKAIWQLEYQHRYKDPGQRTRDEQEGFKVPSIIISSVFCSFPSYACVRVIHVANVCVRPSGAVVRTSHDLTMLSSLQIAESMHILNLYMCNL